MTLLHPFRKLTFLIVLLATSLEAQAQGKLLTMEDAILNTSLQPENLKQLSWVAGTDDFVYRPARQRRCADARQRHLQQAQPGADTY